MEAIRSIAIPPLTPDLERVLIDADTIQRRVTELANQINNDYANITEPLILVGVLKGSFIYLADLCRKLTVPHVVDFIAVSSYGKGSETTGNVRLLMDTRENMENHHVLIVEDIIDSGNTLHEAIPLIEAKGPNSVQICTLLNKASRREVDVPIRYCGFDIEDKFVYGYGLDLDDYFRNLPFIGVVDIEKLKKYQNE